MLGTNLHSYLLKTCHGRRHPVIYTRKNIGLVCTTLHLNGFAQTHYVASSMVAMSFNVLATQGFHQDYQIFHLNQ
jgi:hypothetical protein